MKELQAVEQSILGRGFSYNSTHQSTSKVVLESRKAFAQIRNLPLTHYLYDLRKVTQTLRVTVMCCIKNSINNIYFRVVRII